MEAEYVAVADSAKEALWLGRLEVTFRQSHLTWTPVVLSKSQGAIALARNPVNHNASKCMKVRYEFVRKCVMRGKLSLEKVSMAENVADAMRKSVPVDRFQSLRELMGVERNSEQ